MAAALTSVAYCVHAAMPYLTVFLLGMLVKLILEALSNAVQ